MKYGRIAHEIDPGVYAPLAAEGEPVFVLRAQDVHAATVVTYYADLRRRDGDAAGADECERVAALMKAWPKKKRPD